jgi:hypothetical protein
LAVDDIRTRHLPDPGADPLLRHARRLLDESRVIIHQAETARWLVAVIVERLAALHCHPPPCPPSRPDVP